MEWDTTTTSVVCRNDPPRDERSALCVLAFGVRYHEPPR